MTFGTGSPSWLSTRMFVGFKSRWMIPFWCACCTAEQIWRKSVRRSGQTKAVLVAIVRQRDALDQLHDEERPATLGGPGVEDLGDVRVVHQSQGLALRLEPGQDGLRVHAGLDELRAPPWRFTG